MDCGVRPMCAITGMPRSARKRMVSAMRRAAFELDGAAVGFLHDAGGVAEGDCDGLSS